MGQTPSQVIDNVTNSITNVVTNTMSSVGNNISFHQTIKADCTNVDLPSQYAVCVTSMTTLVQEGLATSDDVVNTCKPITQLCSVSDITFYQNIMWTDTTQISNSLQTITSDTIKNALSQYQDSATDQQINQITQSIINLSPSLISNVTTNGTFVQNIDVNGVHVYSVSMSQSAKIITSTLLTSSEFTSAVHNIANTVTQVSQSTYNTILTVAAIVVGSLIIFFLIIALSKSTDVVNFFSRTLPFIIFIVLASLITLALVTLKPSYITYIDTNGNKQIDKSKLLLYLSIYYVSLIFVIWLTFFVISRIKSKKR